MKTARLVFQLWSDSEDKHPLDIEFEEVEFDRVAIRVRWPERIVTMGKRDLIRALKFLTEEEK